MQGILHTNILCLIKFCGKIWFWNNNEWLFLNHWNQLLHFLWLVSNENDEAVFLNFQADLFIVCTNVVMHQQLMR
jgi:hypothetical protein